MHRGEIVVTGLNTYTGPTDINGATLTFDSIANVGGAPNALGQPLLADSVIDFGITAAGGSAPGTLNYIGNGHTSDRAVHLPGNTQGGVIQANGTGPLTLSGGITAKGTNKTLTLSGGNTDANTISGVIQDAAGAGVLNVTKLDNGTWILSGNNTYGGLTNLNAGTTTTATSLYLSDAATLGGIDLTAVPEPSALSLIGIGALTLRRRRKPQPTLRCD